MLLNREQGFATAVPLVLPLTEARAHDLIKYFLEGDAEN